MYSILIAALIGAAAGVVVYRDFGTAWAIVSGLAVLIICQILIGLFLRRRIVAAQKNMESIMMNGQAKAQRLLQQYQMRPPGSVKAAQQQLEKVQLDAVRAALAATADFEKYYRWSPTLRKQTDAMKLQLHFQLREFAEVDRLLPHALLLDPRAKIIKLVRLFKQKDAGLDKFYRKKLARLKSDDGAFAACTYAWMLLKNDNVDRAREVLLDMSKRSNHEVLAANLTKLSNDKAKQFSNAGFGDLWYSLYLEEPKVKVQRQQPRF